MLTRDDFEENTSNQKEKLFIEFTRLLHSSKCIQFYIILIICSVFIFTYSIIAYFLKWNELPIIICESVLIIIVTADMFIRIYVTVKFIINIVRDAQNISKNSLTTLTFF